LTFRSGPSYALPLTEVFMTTKKSLTKKVTGKPAKKLTTPKGQKITNMKGSEFTITKYLDSSSPK
jgi:hypothetical protein